MFSFAFILIVISLISIFFHSYNNIIILLSLELFFLGISLIFFSSSFLFDDFQGLLASLFLLSLAALESALGLTILLLSKKHL